MCRLSPKSVAHGLVDGQNPTLFPRSDLEPLSGHRNLLLVGGAVGFETICGLARDEKTNGKGTPNLLQAAVIARSYAGEFRLATPPWPVQQLLFAILAPIGRLLGHRPTYPA